MLNRIKKNILPMLDTLGDALTQYLAQPMDELLGGIEQFIDAINTPLINESEEAIVLSVQLKESLKNPVLSEVEGLYNEYYAIIENLPIQYKAIFLPYYDNTWDSLASVYEAFAADPMFVTEIVIIPIRRNTPTGWKIVYEDYLTPQGIQNTPFSSYSFENDLPDFVFYNNPYDGVNIEKFQSHVIKPYVGCMVYIPYFLYQHTFLNKADLEGQVEQLTQLPGHDNSDIFIAQGKSFLKTFAHRSRNGKKMVALGSPKTDNIYTRLKDCHGYPEWDKKTRNKTTFLLNTHYRVAANKPGPFILHLFEFVEQNNDLSLIWRPHPQSFLMLDADNQSENYLAWQEQFDRISNHDRMILDRTASSAPAIMYSDAVVSHASSIVAEAIFADKPVLVLSMDPQEVVPPDKWANMSMEDYIMKLKQIRKYNIKNLFLYSAVCHLGLERPVAKEEFTLEYWLNDSLLGFVNDIRKGVDRKKELRGLFREQLFVNRDGTCGQSIHDYIVGLIKP